MTQLPNRVRWKRFTCSLSLAERDPTPNPCSVEEDLYFSGASARRRVHPTRYQLHRSTQCSVEDVQWVGVPRHPTQISGCMKAGATPWLAPNPFTQTRPRHSGAIPVQECRKGRKCPAEIHPTVPSPIGPRNMVFDLSCPPADRCVDARVERARRSARGCTIADVRRSHATEKGAITQRCPPTWRCGLNRNGG